MNSLLNKSHCIITIIHCHSEWCMWQIIFWSFDVAQLWNVIMKVAVYCTIHIKQVIFETACPVFSYQLCHRVRPQLHLSGSYDEWRLVHCSVSPKSGWRWSHNLSLSFHPSQITFHYPLYPIVPLSPYQL